MIDAGIFDGDCVVIRSQNEARNGEFVAAMIDGEATVKEPSVTVTRLASSAQPGLLTIPGDECYHPRQGRHRHPLTPDVLHKTVVPLPDGWRHCLMRRKELQKPGRGQALSRVRSGHRAR